MGLLSLPMRMFSLLLFLHFLHLVLPEPAAALYLFLGPKFTIKALASRSLSVDDALCLATSSRCK